MREIEVSTFLGNMDAGVSRPVLVIGDDFNEYILKNEKVDNDGSLTKYDCMFVNELLAYQIGIYLGIPMPEAVIAIVDGEFINEDPTLRFAYRFEVGKYFATEKLKYVENNLHTNWKELSSMGKPYMKKTWNKFFKDIENKDDIAKILAFDIFIANFDRYNNEGNVLINREGARKVYAIDHGHAFFGPEWKQEKTQCLNLNHITEKYIENFTNAITNGNKMCGAGVMFKVLEEYVDLEDLDNHPFKEVVFKILNITEELVDEWLDNIPGEWYLDKEYQGTFYKKFLLSQKHAVAHIIQCLANRDAFTNYKGGLLQWNMKKEKFITV